jgi:hypothetical protein
MISFLIDAFFSSIIACFGYVLIEAPVAQVINFIWNSAMCSSKKKIIVGEDKHLSDDTREIQLLLSSDQK